MGFGWNLVQKRLFAVICPKLWNSSSSPLKLGTSSTAAHQPNKVENHQNLDKSTPTEVKSKQTNSKTITENFTDSLTKEKAKKIALTYEIDNKLLQPIDGYASRFQYSGFLRKSHWQYYDGSNNKRQMTHGPETGAQFNYRMLKKQKFCILMGFAGGNYHGMQFQFNKDINTIEKTLFDAMTKNGWILSEHVDNMWLVDFMHGSRTDTGVSAARMNVSMVLPIDVNIEALNKDLPSDIRVFGMKRATQSFNARRNCSARTYSYTLPTLALSHYSDQSGMTEYRVTADRLQRANEVLSIFNGQTNFHNYTKKKQFFDPTAERTIHSIECGRPFLENDVEFVRITVTGAGFMLYQIRKMIGFTLAVVRGLCDSGWLKRSLANEEVHTPIAPGLGLVLERLHFTAYANRFADNDPLTFDEFDGAVDEFRREKIHSFIVETEIREQSMVNWLQHLIYVFDNNYLRNDENSLNSDDSERYDDAWGENEQFVEKLKKLKD